MNTYLRNCWYVAAWGDEVTGDAILARTLLDEPVAIYRDEQGTAHALEDRCPHRFAPLSVGKQKGDGLECRYHGLCFGPDGACTDNPHGPVTRSMRVRSYPLVERHRALWIWMGSPESADPAAIRDLSFIDTAPPTAYSKGYVHGDGNYQLFVDNILDLTHADYLHPDTLGGGAYTMTRAQITEDRGILSVLWDCKNVPPSPLAAQRLMPGQALVDSWTEVRWSAPAVMVLRSGTVLPGASREGAGEVMNVHVMTPETAKTCHYFYAATRNFARDDAKVNELIASLRDRVFATEDEPMIRAQQARMGDKDFWELNPLLLRIDEGAVRVRRTLEGLIAREIRGTTPE